MSSVAKVPSAQHSLNGMVSNNSSQLPNGQYILAFEYGQFNEAGSYSNPVHYKIATSPENFASEPARKIIVDGKGAQPRGGPYITWTPKGGKDGTIILSDSSSNGVYINRALGQGNWQYLDIPIARAFSRELKIRKWCSHSQS